MLLFFVPTTRSEQNHSIKDNLRAADDEKGSVIKENRLGQWIITTAQLRGIRVWRLSCCNSRCDDCLPTRGRINRHAWAFSHTPSHIHRPQNPPWGFKTSNTTSWKSQEVSDMCSPSPLTPPPRRHQRPELILRGPVPPLSGITCLAHRLWRRCTVNN